MMLRKRTTFLIIVSLSLMVCLSFIATESNAMQRILVYVNGEEVKSDSNPTMLNNRVYVPIRFISEALGAEVHWDPKKRAVNIDSNIKLIASIPEQKIFLYALNKEDNMYRGLILGINGVNKLFDWETISQIEQLPELHYVDLNGDNKKEVAIILNRGSGTGVCRRTIHIINPENLSEYKIEDPLEIIKDNVETKILSPKEVEIKVNDDIANINIDNIPKEKRRGALPDTFSEIYYEDWQDHQIVDNTLSTTVGVEVDWARYIGQINIDYSFKDGEFKANKILFKEDF